MTSAATRGPDGRLRCPWGNATDDYREYHDVEWGRPVRTDNGLYERLTLEGFQSGLSWLTILRKRESFRSAFAGFDIGTVARFNDDDRARLLADPGIVRHPGKVDAALHNARVAAALDESLADLVWRFAPPARPAPRTLADVPAQTPESADLARELKRRGFRFVGPITAYSLMQAVGLVDDHLADCESRGRSDV